MYCYIQTIKDNDFKGTRKIHYSPNSVVTGEIEIFLYKFIWFQS